MILEARIGGWRIVGSKGVWEVDGNGGRARSSEYMVEAVMSDIGASCIGERGSGRFAG
jgi:hypothetical protein